MTIKYGKADKISETVKEAYRDLLSSNDKTFAKGNAQGGEDRKKKEDAKSRNGSGSGLVDSDDGRDAGGADFSFKGKLSLGVDLVGNTLLVSAEGEPLLELVCEMIGKLDEAAKPSGQVEVVKLSGEMSGETLKNALRALSGQTTSTEPSRPGKQRNGDND